MKRKKDIWLFVLILFTAAIMASPFFGISAQTPDGSAPEPSARATTSESIQQVEAKPAESVPREQTGSANSAGSSQAGSQPASSGQAPPAGTVPTPPKQAETIPAPPAPQPIPDVQSIPITPADNLPAEEESASTTAVVVATLATLVGLGAGFVIVKSVLNKGKKGEKNEDKKGENKCDSIKELLEQKVKEYENMAKSWPEERIRQIIKDAVLNEESKEMLAKAEAAKAKYGKLKESIALLKGKYDLCKFDLPSKESIVLVKAFAKDITALIAVEKSVAGQKTYSALLEESEWQEEFKKGALVYLVKKGDVILGNASYEKKEDGSVYISGIVIKPDFQNKGIGKFVMGKILEELKDAKLITLVTHPENKAAIKLYQSFGFKMGERKENYFGDGEPRIVMSLEK